MLLLGMVLGCGGGEQRATEIGRVRFEQARSRYEKDFADIQQAPVVAGSPVAPDASAATPAAGSAAGEPIPGADAAARDAAQRPSPGPEPGAVVTTAASSPAPAPGTTAGLAAEPSPPGAGRERPGLVPSSGALAAAATPKRGGSQPQGAASAAAVPGSAGALGGSRPGLPGTAGGALPPPPAARPTALTGEPAAPASTPVPSPSPTPSPEPEGSDSQPPRLVRVELLPPAVNDGADVRILVSATDNLSGVASGSGSFTAPSGKVFIPFALALDAAVEGQLAGTFKVPPEAQTGSWSLTTLTLLDKAQNAAVLRSSQDPILAATTLTVQSSRADTEPPLLESVTLTPSQIEDGGTVRVTVRASDEKSTVASVRGILANPSRTVQLNFYPRLEAKDGTFVGSLAIPKHSEFGEWGVTLLTLTDSAANRLTIPADDERLRAARITVTSAQSDTQPPQLQQLLLVDGRVQNGQPLRIQVIASDDVSGVRGVDGWVKSPNAKARLHFTLRSDPVAGNFSGSVVIPVSAAVGTWRVERLTLVDAANNRTLLTEVDPALAGATFEVY